MKGRNAVCLLSGGLDSSTLLAQLKFEEFNVTALSVDYGQRHRAELKAAQAIADAAQVRLVNVSLNLSGVFAGAKSSQVGDNVDVPHGHYAAENMKLTIVPNRNMLLLSIAGALAESISEPNSHPVVAYAAHAGDHAIYPDCRPEFVEAAAQALFLGTYAEVSVYAPFVHLTKTDIAMRARMLRVPYELTYSCYEGREIHCGLCGTCVERKEAFRDSGIVDPTTYAA